MATKSRAPLGVELVKRGVVTEEVIEKAIEYQKSHATKKIGDILNILQSPFSPVFIGLERMCNGSTW